MLFLHLHGRGLVVSELFWGLWLLPLGCLVYKSRFLPRFLGAWLVIAGVGWVILCFTGILAPQFAGTLNTYLQPAILGEIAFMFWLLIRGARPPQLEEPAIFRS